LALDNIAAILQTAGCTLSDVVKTTCFLADTSDFTEFDRLYRARFKDRLPARPTVGVAFSEPWILVEIEAVALSGAST
jgi:2-iminobutanoate/2-iminopropanoate deaminase